MQIDTVAAIDLPKGKKQNESSFSDQMKAYLKHPGSGVLALLTLLGAVMIPRISPVKIAAVICFLYHE